MKNANVLFFLFWVGYFGCHAQTFDPVLAGQLQDKLDSIRSADNLKGISASVFYPGLGTWQGVAGISHNGAPISSEMLFGIASNTKLFTGVLLLKLADHHILQLDDSLHRYLPYFQNIDSNITLRQLLNHTSGLADVTSVPGYPDSMLNDPNRIFTASEMMTWASTPLFSPGAGWDYCNTNYLLAAMVAESATGTSYHQLLRQYLLTPLQLDHTFLAVYENIPFSVAQPWQAGVNNHAIPRTSVNSAAWSAGAMYSNSGDMVRWYRALMGGQVLSANAFQSLTTFVGSGNYGMGISEATVLGRTVWTHGGNIWGGYNSSMMYDPATGMLVCVLINQIPAQAYQVSIQLLSTMLNHTLSSSEGLHTNPAILLYPNPTSEEIYLALPNESLRMIQVYNAQGQCVKETTEQPFTLSGHPNGTYMVLVQTNMGYYQEKIIKQ
jgi:D-alanyl-D-alanine carboxypeptidase